MGLSSNPALAAAPAPIVNPPAPAPKYNPPAPAPVYNPPVPAPAPISTSPALAPKSNPATPVYNPPAPAQVSNPPAPAPQSNSAPVGPGLTNANDEARRRERELARSDRADMISMASATTNL